MLLHFTHSSLRMGSNHCNFYWDTCARLSFVFFSFPHSYKLFAKYWNWVWLCSRPSYQRPFRSCMTALCLFENYYRPSITQILLSYHKKRLTRWDSYSQKSYTTSLLVSGDYVVLQCETIIFSNISKSNEIFFRTILNSL